MTAMEFPDGMALSNMGFALAIIFSCSIDVMKKPPSALSSNRSDMVFSRLTAVSIQKGS